MRTLYRYFSVIAFASSLVGVAFAGTVTGRIMDATTGLALAGVRVTVEATALETYSSPDGHYSLRFVPEGEQQLQFSYVGYPDVTRALSVLPEEVRLDVNYTDTVIEMDRTSPSSDNRNGWGTWP